MKKYILISVLILVALLVKASPVMAKNNVVTSSASLKQITIEDLTLDYRVATLSNFLEKYNSPISDYAESFIYWADYYGIDWRLVAAISGVESTFGKRIPPNSYNAYGWANGKYVFTSWDDSIRIVSKTLKEKYYDRGANTIPKIARIYAPPSTTWAWKVEFFMNKIDHLPLEFDF
ncbi:hypothetical protein A2115_00080 [Candidatus Woesebacteria bacterium GWA1_41_8]|jgi:hypothetical protein|uniref:Mannosyl-glycoprotein endo-beta-N-acetylglucosamidase-like domain-containing protein n=1 Tax=Candidatus Woesebacteria bacterium GWA1_41_8 TaxID=1802471 RepID=A0A1F7WLI1_9BACT|nr:MAG: hypothetical protein A2115_00080 [Candidatus Woesebacteria bacterium GWA1_41_8]